MPEDNTPETPMMGETPTTPVENVPETETSLPLVETTPEVPSETPVIDVPADGAVSPEELAAFSQPPVTVDTAPTLDAAAPVSPVGSPFGASAFGSPTPDLTTPKKSPNKKKMIIIGAIIIGALGLLSGGTAAAYNLWYQNPDKVVLEAVGSLLQQGTSTHKISVDVTSKDVTVKLTVDAKVAQSPATQEDIAATVTSGGKDYKVTGSTLTDKDGNLYFKLNDVKSLLAEFAGSSADFSAFNDVITKVDGQWVKVSSDDLKSVSADYSKTQTCTTDALKSLGQKATTDEIMAVYKKNDFIIVGDKLGAKDINGVGSLGYKVTLDKAKANAFYAALGDTKVGKALTACDSSFDFKPSTDTTTNDSQTTTNIQVWSSRFGHQLTELDLSDKSNGTTTTLVWNPTFVKGVTVDAPATSVPLKDVMTMVGNDYTNAYTSSYTSGGMTYSSDLSAQQNAFKLTSLL